MRLVHRSSQLVRPSAFRASLIIAATCAAIPGISSGAKDHPPATGASVAAPADGAPAQRGAPLFDNLGDHHHPVTTRNNDAQRYFNQGLTLCYAFNHGEAIRSFDEAARLDPNLAMAHWGIAFAHGPNINAPMSKEAAGKAWAALQKAVALRQHAGEQEQAYIDALAKRYAADAPDDRAALDKAFAEAMRDVAKRYPDDLDAATLYAEATMDTMPWDYWKTDKTAKPEMAEAIGVLEAVLRRKPDHAGACHLYIHAVEAGPSPERAVAAADTLGTLVPGAGHLVHMPSHIYLRVGRYLDATQANERAALADEAYIAQCRGQGFYPATYYPHNVHFLWYSTGMEGRSRESIAAALKMAEHSGRHTLTENDRLRPLGILAMARFGKWDDILRQPAFPAEQKMATAMRHYARGLAFAAQGKPDAAEAERASLEKFVASKDSDALEMPTFPGKRCLQIALLDLTGEIARRGGKPADAVKHFVEAAKIEDGLPYMEPPFQYFPVRHALGAALLESGKPVEAERVYREDLKINKQNGWALYGLLQSERAQGKSAEAAEVERQFQKAWALADVTLTSSRP